MKKFITAITAAALMATCMGFAPIVSAKVGTATVISDKTAQWTAQESGTYDGRIHGWQTWETAVYTGFSLEDFTADGLCGAELVLTTTGIGSYYNSSAGSTAYIYMADYSSFASGGDYTGTDNAPSYNTTQIAQCAIPTSTGEYSIDVTDYIETLEDGAQNAAFRIDVRSQNNACDWHVGTLTNGGVAPKLVLHYGDTIINGDFSSGTNGWSISGSADAENGALVISDSGDGTRVSQTISDLSNGTYDLTLNARVSDIDGIYYAYAKTAGHTMVSTAIVQGDSMVNIIVPGIIVDDGVCEIGIYAKGLATVTADDFSMSDSSDSTRVPFLKGGEISKLTYVEDRGGKFYRADGTQADALQIMAENGFNLARIRVLNDPGKGYGDGYYYLPAGYQTEDDCLELARRAKAKGMQIEFTFAYSDYWTDGGNQIIPHEWQEYIDRNSLTGEAMYSYLEEQVYEYTKSVMNKLIDQGTTPEFVSIGNEMQAGMLFGNWETATAASSPLYYNATYLARFVNAGARAVRETSPETKIVIHSDNGGKILSTRDVFVALLSQVDCDVVAVSFYPYYNADVSIDTVVSEFNSIISSYDMDVMIMETGYNWSELRPNGYDGQLQDSGYYTSIYGETQDGQRAFLTELYAKLKTVLGGRCIADLYWDPVMIYDGGVKNRKNAGIGWAIDESKNTTQENVISNSTIFDFDGKAVAGQLAMKYNTNATDQVLITGKVTNNGSAVEDTQIKINVNGKNYISTTDKFGEYIVAVDYPSDEMLEIYASGAQDTYSLAAPQDGVLVSGINFDGDIAYTGAAVLYKSDSSQEYSATYGGTQQICDLGAAYGSGYDTFKLSFDLSFDGNGSYCNIWAYSSSDKPLMFMNAYDNGYAYGTSEYSWQSTVNDNKNTRHIDVLVDKTEKTACMYMDGVAVTTLPTEAEDVSYITMDSTWGDADLTIENLCVTTDSEENPIESYYNNTVSYSDNNGVLTATGTFEVYTDTPKALAGIIAKYDENGIMIDINAVNFTSIAGEETTETVTIELSQDDIVNNVTVKAFLWQSENMVPVANAAR